MAREIDPTQELSDDDIAYLQQRPWKWAELGLDPIVPELGDDDSEPGDGEEVETNYDDLSKDELATLAHSRGLAKSGTKDEIIARLVEQDEDEV